MNRLTKRSYYTVIALSVVAATLLVLPVQALPSQLSDMTQQGEREPQQKDEQSEFVQVSDTPELSTETPTERTTTFYVVRHDDQTEDAPIIASIEFYEKIDVTPNEEVAGVITRRFEDTIWQDDFVRRVDES